MPEERQVPAGARAAPQPPQPPQDRRPIWVLALVILCVCGLFAACGMAAAVKVVYDRYNASFTRETLLDPDARGVNRRQLTGPLNYLLIGSDLRAANPGAGQRSDTIVIVQANSPLTHVHLVSIPRDLRVTIPAQPQTGFTGSKEKINSAFDHGGGGSGGVRLLSATLTRLTGLRFDGAAVIDFGGFKQVVDVLGGVTLCIDRQVRSIHTGRLFTVGCQQLNGAEALDYSRQRYGLPAGDFDRQRHQQQVLKAIFAKALDGGVTRNPIKIDQLVRSVGGSLTVDTSGANIADLFFSLRNIRPDALTGVRVPCYDKNIGNTSFVLLSPEAKSLFVALRTADLAKWATEHPQWVNAI
jgi:LCP family protein required for cell wall assembly